MWCEVIVCIKCDASFRNRFDRHCRRTSGQKSFTINNRRTSILRLRLHILQRFYKRAIKCKHLKINAVTVYIKTFLRIVGYLRVLRRRPNTISTILTTFGSVQTVFWKIMLYGFLEYNNVFRIRSNDCCSCMQAAGFTTGSPPPLKIFFELPLKKKW